MAAKHSFDGWAGQTIILTVSVTQNGSNMSLTTASAIAFTLDTPTQVAKSLGSGIVVSDSPNDHQCTVVISPADTTGQAAGRYPWQLWVTNAAGYKAPVSVGYLTLFAEL